MFLSWGAEERLIDSRTDIIEITWKNFFLIFLNLKLVKTDITEKNGKKQKIKTGIETFRSYPQFVLYEAFFP